MKLYITALILSASIFTATAQNNLQKADMQYDMRDYSLAISTYEKALDSDPDNQEIPAKIAASYVQLQDYLKASKWYEKIIDEDDVKAEHLVAYGDVLKSLRLYGKAKFYYQKLAKYDPTMATYFVNSCDVARIEMNGDPYYEINVLNVNSRSSDFAPFLFHEDLLLSSLRTDIPAAQTRKSKNGKTTLSTENAVYISQKHGTKELQHFKNMAQGEEVISHVKYSQDGKWVAFQKSDFREGQRLFDSRAGKVSLYVAKVASNGQWEDVKAFSYNGNEFSTGYPSLSPDGSVMYFSSTRPGGHGGWDVYVAFRSLSGWTAPQNMGNVINTPGNEIAPYYSDHKLFFSSDRHPGIGGFDIFKASSEEGIWNIIRSMGYPLNSPKDDIDFIWDPVQKMGYFSSNRIGTTGAYDIYSCTPLYEEIMMTVMDEEGKAAVKGARISYRGAKAAPQETNELGQVMIHQRFEETSSITITHDDYKNLDMTLKAPGQGPAKYDVYIDKSLESDQSDVAGNTTSDAMGHQNSASATNNSAGAANSQVDVTTKTVVVGNPSNASGTVFTETASSTAMVAASGNNAANTSPAQAKTTSSTKAEKRTRATPTPRVNKGKYAVQIAAVAKSVPLDQYSSLGTIGQVMQYPEKGMYKIRVGYYDDEAQAKNALRSIKSSGYPDAFIVKANPGQTYTAPSKEEAMAAQDYLVRLGTYSRPEFFDASKVEHLGTIDTYKSGKFTIMLLRGFESYAAADKARIASGKHGFKDAYIVIEQDGGLRKVSY
jgi:tetratricopeptide (TPR) repeat protein